MNNYKDFYLKITKNKKYFLFFVFIISVLAAIPAFNSNTYINCDLTFHLHRIEEISQNLSMGIFLPSIQNNNIFGMGYLVDIFYPNLFLYIPALFFLFTKNIILSFSLFIIVYNIFTFFLCYNYLKNIKGEKIAFYFSVIYILFPYRLMNLYINGFVGEFLACSFLPLVIFGLEKIFEENKYKEFVLGMVGVLYCHTISLLLCAIYVFIYCLFNIKKILKNFKILLDLIKSTILTFIIGSGFLLPFIDNMKDLSYKYNINADKSGILAYGLFDLNVGIEILIQLSLIVFLVSFYKRKKSKNISFLYSLICVYGIIMITKIFPWELFDYIPFLRNIQFSLRILPFIFVFAIYLISELCCDLKDMNKSIILLCVSFVFFTSNIKMAMSNNECFKYKEENGTYLDIVGGEYLPSSFVLDELTLDIFNICFDNSDDVIDYKINKNNREITLEIDTKEKVDVSIPKIYYKNYNVYDSNNKLIPKYENNGLLYLKNIGTGIYYIRYEISNIQIISLFISIISFIIFISIYFKQKINNNKS